mmetsp:Transcript_31834/g.37110  ORF Transcript_31834/g.37110 Transcript_31834/m.37110 type:complete len:81 (+) Transcript_31834:643-885(+)
MINNQLILHFILCDQISLPFSQPKLQTEGILSESTKRQKNTRHYKLEGIKREIPNKYTTSSQQTVFLTNSACQDINDNAA